MAAFGIHLLIFLPLVAAVVVWTLPERRKDIAPSFALVVGLITFVIGLLLWLNVSGAGLLGEAHADWIAVGGEEGGGRGFLAHGSST